MNRDDERHVAAGYLRDAARDYFDHVDLDQRAAVWVDTDSYDAGLLAGARYLLSRADQLETGQ